jgi:hypothetical protein
MEDMRLTAIVCPSLKRSACFLKRACRRFERNRRYQIVRLVKTGKSPWKPKLIGKTGATRKFIIVIVLERKRKAQTYQITAQLRTCY